MKIDNYIKTRIKSELENSGQTKHAFAKAIGKSPGWVTNLLNGKLKSLDEATAILIQEYLNFDFYVATKSGEKAFDQKLRLLAENQKFQPLLLSLIDLVEDDTYYADAHNFKTIRKQKIINVTSDTDASLKAARLIRKVCKETDDRFLLSKLINEIESFIGLEDKINLRTP